MRKVIVARLCSSTERTKCVGAATAKPISTIDLKDIEHHGNLYKEWWDSDGKLYALHLFNPFRLQLVRDGLADIGLQIQNPSLPLRAIKIADIGCGGGIFSECLARAGAHVIGIDASEKLIDVARKHVRLDPDISGRVNYVNTSIEEFSQKNENSCDVVVASEILEHVENSDFFLKVFYI